MRISDANGTHPRSPAANTKRTLLDRLFAGRTRRAAPEETRSAPHPGGCEYRRAPGAAGLEETPTRRRKARCSAARARSNVLDALKLRGWPSAISTPRRSSAGCRDAAANLKILLRRRPGLDAVLS